MSDRPNDKPFIGKVTKKIDKVHFLDRKYHIDCFETTYYFLGFEIYVTQKQVFKHNEKRDCKKKDLNIALKKVN